MITRDIPRKLSKKLAPDFSPRRGDDRGARSLDAICAEERLGDLEEPPARRPEDALAAGVLRQAAADLRRFQDAQDAIGREMYSDAKSWFISNDDQWPYSFINVCRALGLSPEAICDEVFADAQAGWYSHSRQVAGRVAKSVKGSLSNVFAARRTETLALAKS